MRCVHGSRPCRVDGDTGRAQRTPRARSRGPTQTEAASALMSKDWRGQTPSPHIGAHTCTHTPHPSTLAWGVQDPTGEVLTQIT